VAKEDLRTIRHVAFSSIPGKRRELLRALLAAGGRMKSGDVSEALGVTKPTALARMHELAATGICEFVPGCEKTPKAAELYLAKDFNWLL
jgi:predicted ArsR family transcriptional regulator